MRAIMIFCVSYRFLLYYSESFKRKEILSCNRGNFCLSGIS